MPVSGVSGSCATAVAVLAQREMKVVAQSILAGNLGDARAVAGNVQKDMKSAAAIELVNSLPDVGQKLDVTA